MYILVRAGISQTWHDVLDLCVNIFISFMKSYEWGGEGKGKRVFEVQNDIHVRLFRKTKTCTAISLAWERAPQLGEHSNKRKKNKANQAKRYSLGREKGPSIPRDFLCRFSPFFGVFCPQRSLVLGYDPLGNNSSAARKSFGMSMKVAINKLDPLKA